MAALLPFAVVLLGVLLACRSSRTALPAATVVATAPAVGLAFVSIAFFGWRLFNGSTSTFLPVFAFVAIAALALAWRRPVGDGPRKWPASDRGVVWRLGLALLVVATALAAREFQLYRFDAPVGEFDARAIWNAHALLLSRAEEPLAAVFRKLLHGHPSYPLLLPAGLAGQFALLGYDDILTPSVQALVLTVAAAATIWAGLRLLGAGRWAPLAVALFFVTPEALHWGFSQCADIPVAYLFAGAGVGLAVQLSAGRTAFPGWLAGLCLGLLPWTKNEGVLLAAILLAAWLAIRRAASPERRAPLMPVLAGTVPGVASLVAFKAIWSPKDEISMFADGAIARALDPERWRIVPAAFWEQFNPVSGSENWGVAWVLAALLLALGWRAFRSAPEIRFLGLTIALAHLAWLGVYLGTLHDPVWHLETSLNRLLLQLLPLTLVTAFLALERGWLGRPPTSEKR